MISRWFVLATRLAAAMGLRPYRRRIRVITGAVGTPAAPATGPSPSTRRPHSETRHCRVPSSCYISPRAPLHEPRRSAAGSLRGGPTGAHEDHVLSGAPSRFTSASPLIVAPDVDHVLEFAASRAACPRLESGLLKRSGASSLFGGNVADTDARRAPVLRQDAEFFASRNRTSDPPRRSGPRRGGGRIDCAARRCRAGARSYSTRRPPRARERGSSRVLVPPVTTRIRCLVSWNTTRARFDLRGELARGVISIARGRTHIVVCGSSASNPSSRVRWRPSFPIPFRTKCADHAPRPCRAPPAAPL